MSTATYDRPLYAVPAPPDQKSQFAFLLAVRRRAQQALDAALALPRSAAGWALRHLRSLMGGNTQHRLAGWASSGVRSAATLVRGVGFVPLAAALLSTPAVWSRTTRLASLSGSATASIASRLWQRAKSLLRRGGAIGDRIAQALSSAGNQLAGTARAVVRHGISRRVLYVVNGAAAFVRPVSHSLVVHRAVALLIPVAWLRVGLQLIAIPLVMAAGLPVALEFGLPGGPVLAHGPVAQVESAGLKAATGEATAGVSPTEPARETAAATELAPELQPRNRAERRAEQQAQARAKRASAQRTAH